MMSLPSALHEDMDGDVVEAADCYEQAVQAGDAPLEAYLNLAVLYWQCTDYGFNAGHKLGAEFIGRAGERYPTLLQEADQCFPDRPEVKFWMLYCDFITLGGLPFVEECERLVKNTSEPLVPYFYLYSSSNGRGYEREASRLLRECLKQPTVKNKYIASVIEGGGRNGRTPSDSGKWRRFRSSRHWKYRAARRKSLRD